MRRILIKRARRRQAAKRGGAAVAFCVEEVEIGSGEPPVDVIALDAALPRLAAVVPRQGNIVAASPRSLRSGGGGYIHRFTRSGNPERARLSGGGSLSARRMCYFTLSVAVNPLSVSRYSQVPMADGTKRKRVSGFTVPLSNAIPPSGIEVDVTV